MLARKDQTVKCDSISDENRSDLATWRFSFYAYL